MRTMRPHASELVRLVPELAERVPDLAPSKAADADAERYMLFAAVVSLFTALGERQPVDSGPRRPAVGRQREPATTEAHHHFRTRAAAARCRDLQEHGASEFERTRRAARSAATTQHRDDPDRIVGPRRRRRRSAHGGFRRSRARPRRPPPGQRGQPRNRWQSILRRRGSATPGRERCDLPRHHWQVVSSTGPGPHVPPGQRPRRGSGTRGATRGRLPTRPLAGVGDRPRVRPRPAVGGERDS